MAADRRFAFGSFRFDARTGQLWRDGSEVKLTPRAAAVLHMLAERAQELVTKQELSDRVWGGIAVSDDALKATAALVPDTAIGRMLSQHEAANLIRRLERGIPKRPAAASVRRMAKRRQHATPF
jgi:Transcriptional regulatory protein, C terminal